MRTTKLTETQEAVEAEVSFPTSCAQAKFSFEKGSDNRARMQQRRRSVA